MCVLAKVKGAGYLFMDPVSFSLWFFARGGYLGFSFLVFFFFSSLVTDVPNYLGQSWLLTAVSHGYMGFITVKAGLSLHRQDLVMALYHILES